jgi:hypothetical protein
VPSLSWLENIVSIVAQDFLLLAKDFLAILHEEEEEDGDDDDEDDEEADEDD